MKERMRKQKNRDETVGAQKNARTVLKAEGKPDVVVGPQTKEDWKARVDEQLSPEEITEARKWYK